MKKTLFTLLAFSILFTVNAQIKIPPMSPSATISQNLGLANVSINYSRPAMKGRAIFGNLVPFDKVWRTGANKITSITFDAPIKINGAELKAGSYGIYTVPGKESWKIIINRDADQWGAYEYDKLQDVISFEVQPLELDYLQEYLTIEFTEFTPTKAYVMISWEKTGVKFPIEHDVKSQIMSEISEKTSAGNATTETLFTSADYYFQNDYDLPQALAWANKVIEKEQEYWTYQLVARIAAKMNNCAVALPNAEKSMKLAKEAGDDAYVKLNEYVFAICGK